MLTQVDMRQHSKYYYSDANYYARSYDRYYVE